MKPFLSAIFAISENGLIGRDNDLPWRLPNDLKHFKRLTLDKPIIMGRKTWESLGRPLPRRRNIVVTRQRDFVAEGAEVVNSLEAGLGLCQDTEEIFLIGGSTLYQEGFAKGLIDRVYKTLVHAELDGDVFLAIPEESLWHIVEVDAHQADEKHDFAYTFIIMEKA